MRFQRLDLKNFGGLWGREIRLSEGLNLICGENGAGKSTLHAFLKAMLFGMERGRGRAAATDEFSRYEPWENPSHYAGALEFSCGGRQFRLERHFDKYKKGGSLVCLDDGEELSLEQGDLEILLGGMQEADYENTVSVGQLRSAVGASLGASLKDYAANYYAAGSSEIRLEEALEALKERRRETDRELRRVQSEHQAGLERISQEADYVRRDIRRLEKEIEQIQAQQKDCQGRIAAHEEQVRERREKEESRGRFDSWRLHPLEILGMLSAVFLAFFLFERPWNFLVTVVVALAEVLYSWNSLKDGQRKKEEVLLKEERAADGLQEELERYDWSLDMLEEDRREKEVQLENLQEQLQEDAGLEEETRPLEERRQALELAMETIRELARQMQGRLSQLLNHQLSQAFREMTGGRYEKVWVDEQMELSVLEEGRKIGVSQLSRGTAEQLYLALRLTAARILCDESMPVILDDTFAYYDDRRLERTLRTLRGYPGQVIILSCQERERRILDRMKCAYNLVRL